MDALENYRSETNQAVKPILATTTLHHNTAIIRSMDCRVKQIRLGSSGLSTGSQQISKQRGSK